MFRYSFPPTRTTIALLSLLCLSRCSYTQAQSFNPTMRFNSYNAFTDGQALYIGGGRGLGSTSPITETFKIDLSVNWTATKPKFAQLSEGFPYEAVPSTISSDGKQWIVYSSGQIFGMDIETQKWLPLMSIDGIMTGGDMAVVEPETGFVYIPNGIEGSLLAVNLTASTYTKSPMPTRLAESLFNSVVWSASSRKLFLMAGNNHQAKVSFDLFSYSTTQGWSDLSQSAKGPMPSARESACLVPVYGGSKLVLFGGSDISKNVELGDIYVFDVDTLTWTKGPDTTAKDRRHRSACAGSGDYFISWGGIGSGNNAMTTTTLIYNLKTNQWTTSYVAPPPTAKKSARDPSSTSSGAPPTTDGSGNPSGSGTSQAVVIGVSILGAAVAAILAAIGYLYGTRRRRVLKSANSSTLELRDPSTLRSPNTELPSPPLPTAILPPMERSPPRNPHLAPMPTSSGRELGGQSRRGPQDHGVQFQGGLNSSPHTLVSESDVYQAFPYPTEHLISSGTSIHSPQQGEFGTSLVVSNPHTIVDDRNTRYQSGLDAYMDSSPNTSSYDGDWEHYKKV